MKVVVGHASDVVAVHLHKKAGIYPCDLLLIFRGSPIRSIVYLRVLAHPYLRHLHFMFTRTKDSFTEPKCIIVYISKHHF